MQSKSQTKVQTKAQRESKMDIFPLCGEIDLCIKKLQKKAVGLVGLSRSGKSTLFNYINRVQLQGVTPKGVQENRENSGQVQVIYEPRVTTTSLAQANNGMKSVTLLPNISNRDGYSLIDFPGYLDKRKINGVVGVSYVIKAAFEIIDEIKFIIVMKHDYFKGGFEKHLFQTFQGFMEMFQWDQIDEQQKGKLMQSVTLAITISPSNVDKKYYTDILKNRIQQGDDEEFADADLAYKVTPLLEHFVINPSKIYLFKAAILGQIAQPCKIVEEHLNPRTYFNLKQESLIHSIKYKHPIYRLPFARDFANMPGAKKKNQARKDGKKQVKKEGEKEEKEGLVEQIQKRITSFKQLAKILEQFFNKAIQTENLFNPQLTFSQLFEEIKKYNAKYNIYSKEFNWSTETQFTTIFNKGDSPKALKVGITLAKNVFKLFELFQQWPEYENQQDPSLLEKFMTQYKVHLTKIIDLFRDSFCSTYEQEQLILEFLFVAVRGCRQFSMLYQIRAQEKHHMCQQLKDSFQSILNGKPLKSIHKKFILGLKQSLSKFKHAIQQNQGEIQRYIKYLNKLQTSEEGAEIIVMNEYNDVRRQFIEWGSIVSKSPEQKLLAIFQNFVEHKKFVEEEINKLNDEEGVQYPPEHNMKFIHQLESMGNIILNLDRNPILQQDVFAYVAPEDIRDKVGQDKNKILSELIIDQAQDAREIFVYTKLVKSALKSYEKILKYIPENQYTERFQNLEGMAEYCVKNGRIEHAIDLYQDALELCAKGNLCELNQKVKKRLSQIPLEREEKIKAYCKELRIKQDIDPSDDRKLDSITELINLKYIKPYLQRPKNPQDESDSN